jgi:hypothetical protein
VTKVSKFARICSDHFTKDSFCEVCLLQRYYFPYIILPQPTVVIMLSLPSCQQIWMCCNWVCVADICICCMLAISFKNLGAYIKYFDNVTDIEILCTHIFTESKH